MITVRYRIKEYKKKWLIIREPDDKLIHHANTGADAIKIKELFERIVELETELAELKEDSVSID